MSINVKVLLQAVGISAVIYLIYSFLHFLFHEITGYEPGIATNVNASASALFELIDFTIIWGARLLFLVFGVIYGVIAWRRGTDSEEGRYPRGGLFTGLTINVGLVIWGLLGSLIVPETAFMPVEAPTLYSNPSLDPITRMAMFFGPLVVMVGTTALALVGGELLKSNLKNKKRNI